MMSTSRLSIFASLLLLSSLALSAAHSVPRELLHKRDLVVPTNLPGGWTSKGCYTDSVNARTLSSATYGSNNAMTDEACITFCSSKNYIYAGTEFSTECYCSDVIASTGNAAAAGDCNMACSGNANEPCGGSNRLNLFYSGQTPPSTNPGPNSWSFLGCYTDSTGGRTLTNTANTAGGQGALTVAICTSACHASGYVLAGVEYSGECYCGNVFSNGGAPASDGLAGCNMPCNGNSSEYCGGPNRLDVYSFGGANPSASASSSSSPSTTSKSSAKPSNTPTGLPSGWSYAGCYIDNAQGRILSNQQPDNSALTVESCIQTCIGAGYTVAGMEYSTQCFCDKYVENGGTLAPADTDCNMACSGNSGEECGGPNRVSLYSKGTVQTYQAPVAQTSGLPGSWTYQGCLLDNAEMRTFPYQIIFPNNNTATNCLSLCSQYGYNAGGMEYSDECYCGDVANIAAAGATIQPESDCNSVCSGDPTVVCGGGDRISYYQWTGTPLYTWNFPTGNAAGEYVFLIGGVVIPLITNAGVNGKVTFLEKYGTGAPNTTGAYELDLAEINNFTAAWRPMHVKTDIFCSAGLTLPDKVGRQINIGGWANGATYGVRLYWPDGSPGVPGVNDWQENYDEVKLQAGRWYPSAMTLTNGSILVVGGEEGSNGAPVPSLEVLPQPTGGSVVYCDFLDRTDPYNLYPFLAVLPSGGVFIAYYNEARILDESTFATAKTLPNIPGAVNDFLGGRTYPFEGTTVLMPQHAPYSDPLTVMICGGSIPGPEIALDNCVSIQPEVGNPKWTIERMPSKRVISCIAALPDGTYLILNGGQQGRAGFGLATQPNLNAVLYDPSQPVGSRMSVMANTTVARLYHSEAILLQDGRVLVSGSDPEDTRFPQEYRVEVFMPPYLLSGLPRPAYTIQNKDWAYGQSYQIVVTQGSTANLRVSLMGAVASTHGNSMGQRTIFPAFSCNGNTCTVTAPPNAHTSPPGWHQLFILDGPTPSLSTWVRIGGDPAELGNWPQFPDFNVPGV